MKYMNHLIIMITIALSPTTTLRPIYLQEPNPNRLFADKPTAALYWQALLHTAKNNKNDALNIVEILTSNSSIATTNKDAAQVSLSLLVYASIYA